MRNWYWDNHEIDGNFNNEFLLLTFNREITLNSVSFSFWNADRTRWGHQIDGDDARVYSHDGSDWVYEEQISDGDNGTYTTAFADPYAGSMFAIGATDYNDGWKLRSISVDYEPSVVPLPAAGWMLFAGLGGLAAMKRRRKAA
jgi:hypothetical protein